MGHLGWINMQRHITFAKVMGEIETDYSEINVDEINKLIPLDDGWVLNQSNCRYIPPDNYTGESVYRWYSEIQNISQNSDMY